MTEASSSSSPAWSQRNQSSPERSRTEDTRPEGQRGNYGIRADLAQSAGVDASPAETATRLLSRPELRLQPPQPKLRNLGLSLIYFRTEEPAITLKINHQQKKIIKIKKLPGATEHVSRAS